MLTASVRFKLDASQQRSFSLPGVPPGSPSLMYRFDYEGAPFLVGALAEEPTGERFEPGRSYAGVILRFWSYIAELPAVVVAGAPFVVWYGGDVGRGVVDSVVPDADV